MTISDFIKRLMLAGSIQMGDGRVSFLGKYDVILVEATSFAYLIQKLFEMLGEEKAFELIKECSYQAVKKALETFKPPSILDIKSLISLSDIYGLGKFEVIDISKENDEEIYYIIIKNSTALEFSKKQWGQNSKFHKVYEANLHAFFETFLKQRVIIEEISPSKKDTSCVFKIKIQKDKKI